MATLLTLEGPETGRAFPLLSECSVLGRQHDSAICLSGNAVSRHHAQILRRGDDYFIEDLGSSNGTYLNGKRLVPHAPASFYDDDRLHIGPFLLTLQSEPDSRATAPDREPELVIRETVSATSVSSSILGPDAASRLHAVLEITKHLARTLDVDQLLHKLLEQLMVLYPQADRSLVVMAQGDDLDLRAQNARRPPDNSETPFSRTIIRKALEEGIGLLSDDVKHDQRFAPSITLTSLELHSVLCAPLITAEGTRLGVIQIDRFCKGFGFKMDDLQLLTAIASQVTVVLENASLHAERMKEERLLRELALAREIQEGFLPDDLEGSGDDSFEILGRVFPAQQVAGDFYDFFKTPDDQVGFAIGDVSGKGIPAALFMGSCRTLCRYLAQEGLPPAAVLTKLNAALAVDNSACMFVTLIHGCYNPSTGATIFSSAGHPPPLLRRADGSVEELPAIGGRLLGYPGTNVTFAEHRLVLEPGEAIVLFTDGLFEARALGDKTQFGDQRVRAMVESFGSEQSLADWAEEARDHVAKFLGGPTLSDDLTLLLLRRRR
jgi:sigma-B regulation protein RsbU (phosphoserine phosphatase)